VKKRRVTLCKLLVRYLLLCCLTNIPPCTAESPVGLKQLIRRSVMQIIPEPCDHIGCFRPTEFSAAQCRTSSTCATIKCSDGLPLPHDSTLPLSIIKFSIRYFQKPTNYPRIQQYESCSCLWHAYALSCAGTSNNEGIRQGPTSSATGMNISWIHGIHKSV
jgi:hypothetical protein